MEKYELKHSNSSYNETGRKRRGANWLRHCEGRDADPYVGGEIHRDWQYSQ